MIALVLLSWHRALAWGLIIANATAGLWSLAAHYEPRLRGRLLWGAILLAQLFAVAQAIIGSASLSPTRSPTWCWS